MALLLIFIIRELDKTEGFECKNVDNFIDRINGMYAIVRKSSIFVISRSATLFLIKLASKNLYAGLFGRLLLPRTFLLFAIHFEQESRLFLSILVDSPRLFVSDFTDFFLF